MPEIRDLANLGHAEAIEALRVKSVEHLTIIRDVGRRILKTPSKDRTRLQTEEFRISKPTASRYRKIYEKWQYDDAFETLIQAWQEHGSPSDKADEFTLGLVTGTSEFVNKDTTIPQAYQKWLHKVPVPKPLIDTLVTSLNTVRRVSEKTEDLRPVLEDSQKRDHLIKSFNEAHKAFFILLEPPKPQVTPPPTVVDPGDFDDLVEE